MKSFIFIFSLMILNSCGSASKTEENKQVPVDLNGTYHVIQLEDEKVAPETVILNFEKEKNVSGYSGCNNFSSEYVNEGKEIHFSPAIATKRYCEDTMETEKALFRTLSRTKSVVSASENQISFLSEEGKELLRAEKAK